MLRLRSFVSLIGLSTMVAAACGSEGETDATGDAGGSGEASAGAPLGGSSGEGGSGPAEAGAGGVGCAEDGVGTLVVEVSGLPATIAADILIEGPDELALEEAGSLEDVTAGAYTVTASRVFDADPIVRTVFDATISEASFCLSEGASHTIQVDYAAIPSSNKLWMPTDEVTQLAGFSADLLGDSGTTLAAVAIDGPASASIVFDKDGNLWSLGPTTADPEIVRYAASDLGESSEVTPDVGIDVPELACGEVRSLAFDADGNLWLSSCLDQILRLPAAELTSSGDKAADVLITGLDANRGMAFDSDGNLWVAGGPALARYDAARLSESTADAADLLLTLSRTAPARPLKASNLAFDKAGNLWGTDFGANEVFQVAAADLAGAGEADVVVNISIRIAVAALLNAPAFDESDGLWLALSSGTFGKLSAEQLGTSSGPGMTVTPSILIESASIGADLPLAFFPAPAGLPLYHSQP